MSRRVVLKWVHWLSFAGILYFFFVEPEENRADPAGALSTHAGVGLLLAIAVLVWTIMYLRKGLASRPGPKLPGWAKTAHPLMHRVLYVALPVMMLTGAAAGLAAPFVVRAFGVVPLGPGSGTEWLHDLAYEIHEIAFDVLVIMVVAHIVFHLWRHYALKDNALRIMAPRALHRWL